MKNIGIILISVIMLLSIFLISVAQDGFDEFGYNFDARIFNGLLGNIDEHHDGGDGYPNTIYGEDTVSFGYSDVDGYHKVLIYVEGAHAVEKWSKGLDFGGADPIGTWQTLHIEGYGEIYDVDGGLFYEGELTIFYKMQLEKDAAGNRINVITQLVINDQEPVVLEIPPGFGVRIPKEVEY
ncbi:hypothetical protein ES708_34656 [subsurface metagenome]